MKLRNRAPRSRTGDSDFKCFDDIGRRGVVARSRDRFNIVEIADNEIEFSQIGARQRLLAIVGGGHAVAQRAQRLRQARARIVAILNDQDSALILNTFDHRFAFPARRDLGRRAFLTSNTELPPVAFRIYQRASMRDRATNLDCAGLAALFDSFVE